MPPIETFLAPIQFLETPRRRLRVETEREYTSRFSTNSATELMVLYGFGTEEEAEIHRRKVIGGFSTYETTHVQFLMALKEGGQVIGNLSLHNWFPTYRRSELGYTVTSEAHKGAGLMSEALQVVLQFGFDNMKLNRIEAFIQPDNAASIRLVKHKGFVEEGRLRQHYAIDGTVEDSIAFGLLKDEWLRNTSG